MVRLLFAAALFAPLRATYPIGEEGPDEDNLYVNCTHLIPYFQPFATLATTVAAPLFHSLHWVWYVTCIIPSHFELNEDGGFDYMPPASSTDD